MRESITLAIENTVYGSDKYVPLTGVHSLQGGSSGWLWDRRKLTELSNPFVRYDTFLGGHDVGLLDGTKLLQWESGVLQSGDYLGLTHYIVRDYVSWTPQFRTGFYSLFHDVRRLYSDHSFSTRFDPLDNESGVMVHTLRSDAVHASITVSLYERDSKLRIFQKHQFKPVSQFTGTMDEVNNVRIATQSGGSLIFGTFEPRKQEFLINSDKVYLNNDYELEIGALVVSSGYLDIDATDIELHWENKGLGVSGGRSLFTNFFPLKDSSLRLISKDSVGGLTEYTEVSSLDFSAPTDLHFSLEPGSGTVDVGGRKAPDLVLAADADDVQTTITVFLEDVAMDQYSEQGVIIIGTEEIQYLGKTRTQFVQCTRGFNSTVAAVHTTGDVIEDRRHGLGADGTLFIAYTALPKVQYEVTDYDVRSANKYGWLDVNPGRNGETNDIVQILSSDISLNEIVLETDSASIGGNLFGPVFYGTDISRLTARGLDALGNPVEDIDLTIEIQSGPGSLNGQGASFTDTTNSLGEIYSLFNSPYSASNVELNVGLVTHVAADTEMVVNGLSGAVLLDNIWVFQVLKHDHSLGTIGDKINTTAVGASTAPWGAGFFTSDELVTDDYWDGLVQYTEATVKKFANITHINRQDTTTGLTSTVYTDADLTGATLIRLLKRDSTSFDESAMNGVRVILYEFDASVEHPITAATGAFFPVHPDAISGNTITFTGRNLPIPAPTDDTSNLAGYVVYATAISQLQATGTDPASGRVITSNIVRLSLELPTPLVGVDTSGALPVPKGFTFVTESFNVGAGLGGANFITINPQAAGINAFSLTGAF